MTFLIAALLAATPPRGVPAQIAVAVHIIGGSLGIIAGFVALFVAKGAAVHRKSGMVFVYAMLTMSLMGSTLAIVRGVAPGANAPVGLLTAYLVATALVTVRPSSAASHRMDVGLMLAAMGVALFLLTSVGRVLTSPTGVLYGMPVYPFLIFATITTLAAAGDLQMIRAGGARAIRGVPRLRRHLWRMCTALLIAAFRFSSARHRSFPSRSAFSRSSPSRRWSCSPRCSIGCGTFA